MIEECEPFASEEKENCNVFCHERACPKALYTLLRLYYRKEAIRMPVIKLGSSERNSKPKLKEHEKNILFLFQIILR